MKFDSNSDALLNEPGTVTSNGKPYTNFAYFYRKTITMPVRKPVKVKRNNFFNDQINFEVELENFALNINYKRNRNNLVFIRGRRERALKILRNLKKFKKYELKRDFPAKQATTRLSAHNKFGTISIREVYYAIKKSLMNQR